MAEVDGFKHISVATDDDDVVIRAGVGAGCPEPQAAKPAPCAEDGLQSAAAGDVAAAAAEAQDETPAVGKAPATEEKPVAAKAASPKKKDDGYHETTLDDLKSEPMSKTQKTVIVCALVALVVAVVYYFGFMR